MYASVASLAGTTCDHASDELRALLCARFDSVIYSSWFGGLQVVRIENGCAHLSVATVFLRSWIESHYRETLLECCSLAFGVHAVTLTVRMWGKPPLRRAERAPNAPPPPSRPSVVSKPPIPAVVSLALSDAHGTKATEKRITAESVVRAVLRHYNLSRDMLMSNDRRRVIVRARQVGMYLARALTHRSFPEIGRRFGARDHTTALYAVRRIEQVLDTDESLRADIDRVTDIVRTMT